MAATKPGELSMEQRGMQELREQLEAINAKLRTSAEEMLEFERHELRAQRRTLRRRLIELELQQLSAERAACEAQIPDAEAKVGPARAAFEKARAEYERAFREANRTGALYDAAKAAANSLSQRISQADRKAKKLRQELYQLQQPAPVRGSFLE